MASKLRNPGTSTGMSTATKVLTLCTIVGLVVATAWTVALGGHGGLWFAWAVLGVVTLAAITSRS